MQNDTHEHQPEELPDFLVQIDSSPSEKVEVLPEKEEDQSRSIIDLQQAFSLIWQGPQERIEKAMKKVRNNLSMIDYTDTQQSERISIKLPESKSLNSSFYKYNETPDTTKEASKELTANRKWALVSVCVFGLSQEQFIEAKNFLETVPFLPREEMLEKVIDHLFQEKGLEERSRTSSLSVIQEGRIETNKESQKRKEETVECGICCDDVVISKVKKPLGCGHSFCEECYIGYLSEKIASNQLLEIPCPQSECSEKLTDQIIIGLLPKQKGNEYKTFKKNIILSQNPNLRWCLKPGCGKYTVGNPKSEMVVCECGTKICFKCRNEYHPKKSCEDMLDKSYKDYLKRYDVQKCPKCKSGVEKAEGCNHMTCCVCSYHWCWLCGGKYSSTHYSFLNPFGCAGLKQGRNTRNSWPCIKIYLWRLVLMILFLLFVLILPIIWVVVSLFIPQEIYEKQRRRSFSRRGIYRRRRASCCGRFVVFIASVLFLPVLMLVTLCYGIAFLLHKIKGRR